MSEEGSKGERGREKAERHKNVRTLSFDISDILSKYFEMTILSNIVCTYQKIKINQVKKQVSNLTYSCTLSGVTGILEPPGMRSTSSGSTEPDREACTGGIFNKNPKNEGGE